MEASGVHIKLTVVALCLCGGIDPVISSKKRSLTPIARCLCVGAHTLIYIQLCMFNFSYTCLTPIACCHCVGAHTLIYIQVCMSNFSYTCHKQLFYSVYVNFESYVQILHIHVCPELLDMLIELLVQVLLLCLP